MVHAGLTLKYLQTSRTGTNIKIVSKMGANKIAPNPKL